MTWKRGSRSVGRFVRFGEYTEVRGSPAEERERAVGNGTRRASKDQRVCRPTVGMRDKLLPLIKILGTVCLDVVESDRRRCTGCVLEQVHANFPFEYAGFRLS